MSRLLLALAVAVILVLVGAFVPVNGKTLVERWNAAPSATQFAERGWTDLTARWDGLWGAKPAGKPASKGAPSKGAVARPAGPRAAPAEPVENHSDEDRKALDRIVAEHAADRPSPSR
jgi:hypothetical protein